MVAYLVLDIASVHILNLAKSGLMAARKCQSLCSSFAFSWSDFLSLVFCNWKALWIMSAVLFRRVGTSRIISNDGRDSVAKMRRNCCLRCGELLMIIIPLRRRQQVTSFKYQWISLLELVIEEDKTAKDAAIPAGSNIRTGQHYIKKYNDDEQKIAC